MVVCCSGSVEALSVFSEVGRVRSSCSLPRAVTSPASRSGSNLVLLRDEYEQMLKISIGQEASDPWRFLNSASTVWNSSTISPSEQEVTFTTATAQTQTKLPEATLVSCTHGSWL